MRGKVLGIGMISGDDGNRYNFEPSDIANLGKRTLDSLIGCEVDFQIQENKASSIFIIKRNGSIDDVVNGNNGIVALLITFFFGPFGAFFSWWLLAKWGLAKSLFYSIGYFLALVISGFLCLLIIGYILIPAVYIIMCIHVYKAAKLQE
ncbi:hypothetical protein [Helicobacter winghamensis]|uniref:Uncharacterized protein n=1 Tax=Helicobacter winghamensis TaxID=157268 RepID=A0A2N3PK53_9HELI|nr:hypothetical protein [Helicobacter winghamensis]EEO25872.1 hypothetical protein HWAG_00664 [Helicobacter winghamensis ATCC BAA-430]PKT76911.1 hypothetical protein BCM34_06950 [Helicobacter winghamensis]PKT77051.1 hypothetical protein BCM35_03035 [Helicobacter winghamensis]PKT77574.1 hypothetical protein BCM32_05105 [Helicobacter winghamensis]PKT81813.1 hypothetical protein BCM31_01100 [Helicobacter winghamensis]